MSCINDVLIQKYIDREANPEEVTFVEKHISTCNKCVIKIENQRRLVSILKEALNFSANDSIEIPKFVIPQSHIKTQYLSIKRLSYIFAAACVILFVFIIAKKKENNNQNEIMLDTSSALEIDANCPVTQLPLVVSIIDTKGNIHEHYIK
jgi:hypothetical protein